MTDTIFKMISIGVIMLYLWNSMREHRKQQQEIKGLIAANSAAKEAARISDLEHIDMLRQKNNELEIAARRILIEEEKNKLVVSQRKSSEVRLGQMSEHLMPFLDGFPYNPRDCRFLGMPIDFIIFDIDKAKITFLEVKTGKSQSSQRQRAIKAIIDSGNVEYKEIRLNEKGIDIK